MNKRVAIALGSFGLWMAVLGQPARAALQPARAALQPATAALQPPTAALQPATLAFGGLPLCFAENLGQWPSVTQFSGSVPGATVNFSGDGVTCLLTRRSPAPTPEAAANPAGSGDARDPRTLETLALHVTFPGADPVARVAGEAPAAHYSHYYLGNDPAAWRTDVRNYGAVRYTGLYPGIDLVYHGHDRELEYDFEIAPGADWRRIRVRYDGVTRLGVTPDGDLNVTTRFGRMTERAPVAWQVIDGKRRPVRARYRLIADNMFGFQVEGRLDPTAPLIIDPILHYSTYLGGNSYDEPHGIDYDFTGQAWVVGGTLSPNFPATGTPVPAADYSVFVTRLAANGQSLVWSVFLGGSANQIGYGLDVDAAGNAFISGTTGSNNFPTTPGCYDPSFNGANSGVGDMFVAKLSPSGGLLYSTYLGGSGSDTNTGLALANNGRVYVHGNGGGNYPTTVGSYSPTWNGMGDVVLSVLSLGGAGAADLVYSTFLGGNDHDESHGLCVDFAGNAYIGGATRSSNYPAVGGPPFNGSFDAFMTEIAPLGGGVSDLVYSEKFGGVGQDYGGSVAMGTFNDVYFDGITASANFPTTGGAYQTTYGGGPYDGFVMHLYPPSSFTFWITFLGTTGTDRPGPLGVGPGGIPVVTGATDSPVFPTTTGSFDPSFNGGQDIFITTIDPSGANLLESTFVGGSQDDIPYDFKIDPIGRLYLTGTTISPNFPTTNLAFDTTWETGSLDTIVLKFQPPLPESCAVCVSPADTCCERAPHFQGIEAPTFSQHVLVGTREPRLGWPYCVTIFDLGSPAPTEDMDWFSVLRFNGPFNSWNEDSLGTVFGLTLDEYGNIFVTHTSCYDTDQLGQVAGGGPGAVYRIDGTTGVITTFCRLPNYPDPNYSPGENLPGLGNITYDCRHKQFFVTNLEDGRIYRITPNGVNAPTGSVVQVFDPGVADTGPTNYLTPLNLVPSPGWAPYGERLWGVQWHMDRVFYSVWAEDGTTPSGTAANEIRSVALNGAGAIITSSDQHELFLPTLPVTNYSMPVADISFHANGKMLLGERGTFSTTYSSPHQARTLEYGCEAGCWLPANSYLLGFCCGQMNSEGGVDYDRFPYTGGPVGRVWASVDAMHLGAPYSDVVYGYQGFRPTGGSNFTSILLDSDGDVANGDKSFIGDIEAPGCVNNDVGQVCGQKFRDLNHNGVKDNGEPALAGWTIVLNGPGGPYTVTTDGQGNYCFVDLPPGSYTLSEVGQAGWVQTAPAGGVYAVSVTSGQIVANRDFGNYACPPTPSCVMPPPGMSAWWTFDETGGTSAAADNAHLGPAKNTLQLFGGAGFTSVGEVGNALHLGSAADYARLPNIQQSGLDFGTGSFAFDAWVNVSAGLAGPRVIAEKRTLTSSSPYRTRGWALYLNGQQCVLEIGTSEVTATFAGPTIAANSWTHVAVSVDRAAGLGTWYMNGEPISALSFSPPTGTVFNNADLYVGQRSPAFGPGVPFDGYLDELEFFHSPLAAQSAAAIPNVGHAGKCREYCRVPQVTSICKDKTTVTVCMNIVNNTNAPQSYHWSMAGLPAGAGCTVNGPISFSPAAGTVTVPAGSTSPNICVTMPRPAGLTAQNATACFAFTYVNDQTGVCRSCTGTIRADNSCWCVTPVQTGVVNVGQSFAGGIIGVPIDIGVRFPCDPIGIMAYQVSAVYEPGDHPDPHAVRLNGLPPGEPVIGTLSAGPGGPGGPGGGGEQTVSVLVTFPDGYDPAGLYQIVMDADTDGDGVMERVSCTPIASTYEADPVSGVPVEPITPQALRLLAMPNPFLGGSTIAFTLPVTSDVDLAIYDLSGRLVRSLRQARLEAGTQNIAWDGRDDSGRATVGGIYFVRLRAGKVHVQTKVVKVR